MEILPPDAPREQWLEARRQGIGGSDIATLYGEGYDSQYRMWLDKQGLVDDDEAGHAATRGRWLEPHLADWFVERTGLAVQRCGLVQHRAQPEALVTPDRLAEDGSCVEIKTFSQWAKVRADWRSGDLPRRVWLQGQWQLAVTGLGAIWFVGYEIDTEPILRGPFARDEQLISDMRERVADWWDLRIRRGEPPAVDLATLDEDEAGLRWPKVLTGAVEAERPHHLLQLLRERAELAAQTSAGRKAETERKALDLQIRAVIADAEAVTIGGRPVVTCKEQDGSVSVDAALEYDHPDIWAQYVTRSHYRVVRLVKGWQEATPA